MWSFIVLSISMVYILTLSNASTLAASFLEDVVYQQKKQDVVVLAEAVEHYLHRVSAVPPVNLSTLVSTEGFEHLEYIDLTNIGYATTTLTDHRITYQKAIIFFKGRTSNQTDAEYLAASSNSCGGGSFASDDNWCKNDDSIWYVTNNRSVIGQMIDFTTVKLDMLLQTVAHAYRLNGVFPDKTSNATAIADDTSVSLRAAVNYAGTAAGCSGVFQFEGVFLSCHDLYDPLGNDIIYHRHNDAFISLWVQLPFLDSAGLPLAYTRNLEIIQ